MKEPPKPEAGWASEPAWTVEEETNLMTVLGC